MHVGPSTHNRERAGMPLTAITDNIFVGLARAKVTRWREIRFTVLLAIFAAFLFAFVSCRLA